MDVSSNERCDSVHSNHLFGFLSRWTLVERYIGLCPFERCPLEQNLHSRMDVSSNGCLLSADLDIAQRNAHSTLIYLAPLRLEPYSHLDDQQRQLIQHYPRLARSMLSSINKFTLSSKFSSRSFPTLRQLRLIWSGVIL